MGTTVDTLAADLQRFFATRFPGGGDSAGSLLLIFDPLGRPLPISEFVGSGGPGIPDVLAHQWAAQCADDLPAANMLQQGVFLPRDGSRLSRWYAAVLDGCAPTATTDAAARSYHRAHGAARTLLDRNKIDVLITGTAAGGATGTAAAAGTTAVYYATGMTPVGWFLDGAAGWQTYRFDAQDRPPTGPTAQPGTTSPAGVLAPPTFEFRVADVMTAPEIADYALTGEVPQLDVLVQPEDFRLELPEHAGGTDVVVAEARPADVVVAEATPADVMVPDATPADVMVAEAVLPEDLGLNLRDATTLEETDPWVLDRAELIEPVGFPAVQVVAQTTTQPATADGFHVSFEYCLVRFTRPWWDDVFLTRSDWCLPGYGPGQVSSGSATRPASAITLMTVGMLVVRNLSIRANWSDRDEKAMATSVSLGPFSLAGASYDSASGTVTHNGMQAIAWLCQVPQPLPPVAA